MLITEEHYSHIFSYYENFDLLRSQESHSTFLLMYEYIEGKIVKILKPNTNLTTNILI